MVNCYSCKANLNGKWTLSYSGYDNGLQLGVDACFVYNGENWIYCFCRKCFHDGNFPRELKDWCAQPLKQILSQELESRDRQIEILKHRAEQRDVEIAELKKTIKKMKYYEKLISQKQTIKIKENDEYICRSKNLLNNMDEQFKNYIDIIKERFSEIIEQVTKQRIQSMVAKLEDKGKVLIQEIEKIQNVIEKIKEVMKQVKTYKQQDLFQENQIEKNQHPLQQKISMKTEELNSLREAIREGRRFLQIN